jgi:hypothetical protein
MLFAFIYSPLLSLHCTHSLSISCALCRTPLTSYHSHHTASPSLFIQLLYRMISYLLLFIMSTSTTTAVEKKQKKASVAEKKKDVGEPLYSTEEILAREAEERYYIPYRVLIVVLHISL